MARWRAVALETFPEHRDLIQDSDSVMMLCMELLWLAQDAHRADDDETLERVYGFAERCLASPSPEVWNAAALGFYEHAWALGPRFDRDVRPWMTDRVIRDCWGLWEHRLSPERFAQVAEVVGKR
jgi:hypothetical protein